jgi:valyl-tRNA synthetase
LWQRVTVNTAGRPESISLASFPVSRPEITDAGAEREMGIVQNIILFARNMRSELKLDPKILLKGTLYGQGAILDIARAQGDAIAKLANVALEFSEGAAPANSAAVRSTPEFDLELDLPVEQLQALRERQKKELEQVEKNIASLQRQLGDEKFLGKAPQHIVDGMRQKLEEYTKQRDKLI